MGQPMPDTLSVNFHEQGDLAVVINRFLEMGDRVQVRKFTFLSLMRFLLISVVFTSCYVGARVRRQVVEDREDA